MNPICNLTLLELEVMLDALQGAVRVGDPDKAIWRFDRDNRWIVAKRLMECMDDARIIDIENNPPHTCPVCGGNGMVTAGFYTRTNATWQTADSTPEKCRSCEGTGVVWSGNSQQQ